MTGQLFVKNQPRPLLGFDDDYKRQLKEATEAIVASLTSGVAGAAS